MGYVITCAGMFGTNKWAREGLAAQHITSHIGLAPNFSQLIHAEKIEAQFLPFGPTTHLIRAKLFPPCIWFPKADIPPAFC